MMLMRTDPYYELARPAPAVHGCYGPLVTALRNADGQVQEGRRVREQIIAEQVTGVHACPFRLRCR